MAKFGQLSPPDFFKADELGLGREYAYAVAWIAQAEMDQLPTKEFRKVIQKLEKIGSVPNLETVLGKTLSERIRKVRHRSKINDLDDKKDVPRDVPEDVPGNVPRDVPNTNANSNTKSPSEIEAASPQAPKAPATKKPQRTQGEMVPLSPDWKPTEAHRAKAKELGLTLDYQAEIFRCHAETYARECISWNGAFNTWLTKADPAKEPAHVKAPQVAKALPGWNDGDTWMGIPKGKTV